MLLEYRTHRYRQIGRGTISWDDPSPKSNFFKIVLNDQYVFAIGLLLCGLFIPRARPFVDFRADQPDQFAQGLLGFDRRWNSFAAELDKRLSFFSRLLNI